MGHLTWPRPFQGRFVICRLELAMFNPRIKFEISTITCNEEMISNAKCKNYRFEPPFGDLGVTHRVHLWLDGKRVVGVGLYHNFTASRRKTTVVAWYRVTEASWSAAWRLKSEKELKQKFHDFLQVLLHENEATLVLAVHSSSVYIWQSVHTTASSVNFKPFNNTKYENFHSFYVA